MPSDQPPVLSTLRADIGRAVGPAQPALRAGPLGWAIARRVLAPLGTRSLLVQGPLKVPVLLWALCVCPGRAKTPLSVRSNHGTAHHSNTPSREHREGFTWDSQTRSVSNGTHNVIITPLLRQTDVLQVSWMSRTKPGCSGQINNTMMTSQLRHETLQSIS